MSCLPGGGGGAWSLTLSLVVVPPAEEILGAPGKPMESKGHKDGYHFTSLPFNGKLIPVAQEKGWENPGALRPWRQPPSIPGS